MASPISESKSKRSKILTFFYGGSRHITTETKNVLLVAATLIAAVTFQAGVNPPGGVWQDTGKGHDAGRAIYASHERSFSVFLVCNTFALSVSIHLILNLMAEYPFFLEVFAATTAMFATYWASIYEITPGVLRKYRLIFVSAVLPYVFQVSAQFVGLLRRTICAKKSAHG